MNNLKSKAFPHSLNELLCLFLLFPNFFADSFVLFEQFPLVWTQAQHCPFSQAVVGFLQRVHLSAPFQRAISLTNLTTVIIGLVQVMTGE